MQRRSALKKAILALGGIALASESLKAVMPEKKFTNTTSDSDGVVIGKSNKKEILYRKTQAWEDFYKVAW
ncbi:hypothetical protein [Helicobacter cetorum]|uniref:Tat pathway signal protein n=1 Tax=Helicobacter cetorum (strain ATCC BAA-429 / MIT 00-7128) TaxID=182217 RepID=I0ENQ2_HELC0|nr:hypothetical protein [Helicobacter cetorum]AFI04571.1 hypothetical protein HCW_06565 [Helicobacter cetorum MIT 00-7128]